MAYLLHGGRLITQHSDFICQLATKLLLTKLISSRRASSTQLVEPSYSEASVEFIRGLPHFTIPLPSRNENCRFVMKPVTHYVGDLINMMHSEDRGIDRAVILDEAGNRISSACSIGNLLHAPFWIQINDRIFKVVPPPEIENLDSSELNKLNEVRIIVGQLYESLNVGEHFVHKEQELNAKLEELKYELEPLEKGYHELCEKAARKTKFLVWLSLGLMSAQFGILAQLTWWEYSWDVVEPITYFVTYGTTIACFAYYCITKQEYNMPEVRERQYLIDLYKRAKRAKFDIDKYNSLKRQIATIEYDLRRLRDPVNLRLPSHAERALAHAPEGGMTP